MEVNENKFLLTPMILLSNRIMEYDYCMHRIKSPWGYCMEFGVWKGKSINYMAKKMPEITFYGFDSFEGLPEDWNMGNKLVSKGHFKVDEMSEFNENVILVKGLFENTIKDWKQNHKDPINFLNIDSDLYSSAKKILFELNDQIKVNTLIRFDELLSSPIAPYPNWRDGEWKALCEWCNECNREIVPLARSWKQGCTILVKQ